MAKREFSPALRAFVAKYITSIEQIEVLLRLHDAPDRIWSTEDLSALLRSSPYAIESRLPALTAAKLVEQVEGGYRYRAVGRLHASVEELNREYSERRFSVIELVFSRPDPLRSFAEAFRLKDEQEEEEHGRS